MRTSLIASVIFATAAPLWGTTVAAPVTTSVAAQAAGVDYRPLKQFNNAFVVKAGRRREIGYSAIIGRGERFLDQYLSGLTGYPVSTLEADAQLAYWLNLHNLLVIKAVLEDDIPRNLRDGRGTGAAPGPLWTQQRVTVEGVSYSLHSLEEKIFASFPDQPNVIFGLYQGIEHGPAYPHLGFSAANVHEELDDLGRRFMASTTGLQTTRRSFTLSPVFDWYAPHLFAGDEARLHSHLATLTSGAKSTALTTLTREPARRVRYNTERYSPRQQPSSRSSPTGVGSGGFGS